jgi:hypothetical protein
MKIKFINVLNVLMSIASYTPYFLVIWALYRGNPFTAFILILYCISMEIRSGFKEICKSIKLGNVEKIVSVIHTAADKLSKEPKK